MGGRLGDFFHTLCIPKHIYNTKKNKANIFLSDKGDKFKLGLQKTFNDLKTTMLHQPYVSSFQIYNAEPIDIDMTDWRKNFQTSLSWNELFFKLYLAGATPPQELTNIRKIKNIKKYNDWLIINRAPYLNTNFFDFNILDMYEQYMLKYLNVGFIFYEQHQYDLFPYKKIVKPIKVSNLEDMINIIGSCKMFMGNQSCPLAIAHALNTNRIIELTRSPKRRVIYRDVYVNDYKFFKKSSYF